MIPNQKIMIQEPNYEVRIPPGYIVRREQVSPSRKDKADSSQVRLGGVPMSVFVDALDFMTRRGV